MNFKKFLSPPNGWRGQAMAEYHVMMGLMAVGLVIVLTYMGSQITGGYETINECVQGATKGLITEECDTENGQPAPEGTEDTSVPPVVPVETEEPVVPVETEEPAETEEPVVPVETEEPGGPSEPEETEEPEEEPEITLTEELVEEEDPGYEPECGEYTAVIVEPQQGNAQHVMIQYPVECDADGNKLPVPTGVSGLSVRGGGNTSYIRATLSDTLSGVFVGWCVDYENPIYSGRQYDADNYSDTSVSIDRPQNLPLILWLINYDWKTNGYNVDDVQGAIWLLVDSTPIESSNLGSNSVDLARLAIAQAGDADTDTMLSVKGQAAVSGAQNTTSSATVDVETFETSTRNDNGKWRAIVDITVLDNLGQPVNNARVSVSFTEGGNRICTTDSAGACEIETDRINTNRSSTIMSINGITDIGSLSYYSAQNPTNTVTVNR
jgi:Flp pilus assembly pilin Flp